MARRIDKLKNREEIIDAILAGRTDREVSKLAGISHVAVGNYRREIIRPRLSAAAKVNRELGIAHGNLGSATPAPDSVELTRHAVAVRTLEDRITKRYQQIDRRIDKPGQKVGEFTSLVNADRGLMEFHAKLTGLYTDGLPDGGVIPCNLVQLTVNVQAPPGAAGCDQALTLTVDPADMGTSGSER